MVKSGFSTTWKSSTQPRKQRKYRYNAPLHVQQKFMHAHLSSDLRKKYGTRNVQLRSGDKVLVLRGQYKKKEGKVTRISLKRGQVFVEGIEQIKKEGSKIPIPLKVSNLMIVSLDLQDKKRKQKLEGSSPQTAKVAPAKKEPVKKEKKTEAKAEVTTESKDEEKMKTEESK